jgi:hypothetical protein
LIDIVQTEAYAPLHVRGAQGARGLKLAVDNDAEVDTATEVLVAPAASANDAGLYEDAGAMDGETHE